MTVDMRVTSTQLWPSTWTYNICGWIDSAYSPETVRNRANRNWLSIISPIISTLTPCQKCCQLNCSRCCHIVSRRCLDEDSRKSRVWQTLHCICGWRNFFIPASDEDRPIHAVILPPCVAFASSSSSSNSCYRRWKCISQKPTQCREFYRARQQHQQQQQLHTTRSPVTSYAAWCLLRQQIGLRRSAVYRVFGQNKPCFVCSAVANRHRDLSVGCH